MGERAWSDREGILKARITIPEDVVYREFGAETVALNLDTGMYHGLNGSAGDMLAALDDLGSVPKAAERLSDRLDVPRETLQADLADLCLALAERGLVQISSP